jgi:glycine oxidase
MLAPQAEANCADDFFQLACRSRDLYKQFAAELLEETGIDIELDNSGTLYIALTPKDEEEITKRYEWQTSAGLPVEKLTDVEARLIEPCISEDVRAALRFPLDVQVENRRLVSALAESNNRVGTKILTGCAVESIKSNRNVIEGLFTSHGFVSTRKVVLAAGAWTSHLSPGLRVEPVRGQMLCFETNPRLTRHVIYTPRGYIVPRMDGRLLAGSTSEQAGFDKRVTASGMYRILTNALEISGVVAGLPLIDSWAGLRPMAPDGLPVLGPCAEIDGLFYATGHYRNGILLAPITGDLIADAIVDGRVGPLIAPFAPDRFHLIAAHQS